MNIAYLNRNPDTHPGGDLIMMHCLMAALEKLGVHCTNIYGEWSPETLHQYDLVVIQHSNFTWSKDNWWKTLASRRPYVVLPIFYPTDALGMTYSEIRTMFENASAVVPLSFTEAREIRTLTGYSGPFHVIPHGTEERFHWRDGGDRPYVMCANARGDKGEQLVKRVCDRLGLHCLYARQTSHKDMPEVYKSAKVFVHSSPDDRMSLTVGEALCSGCRVISSTGDRGNEWFPGIVACDPQRENDISSWIYAAWNAEHWGWTPNETARTMTWEKAALAWKRVYEGAIR